MKGSTHKIFKRLVKVQKVTWMLASLKCLRKVIASSFSVARIQSLDSCRGCCCTSTPRHAAPRGRRPFMDATRFKAFYYSGNKNAKGWSNEESCVESETCFLRRRAARTSLTASSLLGSLAAARLKMASDVSGKLMSEKYYSKFVKPIWSDNFNQNHVRSVETLKCRIKRGASLGL